MAQTLENVQVELDYYYLPKTSEEWDGSNKTLYRITLNLPLPGGKASYQLDISKEMYDNIIAASTLMVGKRK